ncbi:MAG: response regulator receiver protein [Bacteroidetes bacterium]|jgi:CheY-like chemotaxis protein|nr:response regulator receiver protein [Bacteroidota bacterium]MDF2451631.1 response regulator receiver protein [Bacteroidota bacterium]
MGNKETHIAFNVLLADDDKDDRFFFKKALGDINIPTKLVTVPNGEQLMTYLSENSEKLPDVLFLDLNMPRKNGNECLVEIKEQVKLRNMPVIIYSTSLRDEVVDVLYDSGAHYYIQKCDFVELTKTLQTIFTVLSQNTKRPSRSKFVLSLKELKN